MNMLVIAGLALALLPGLATAKDIMLDSQGRATIPVKLLESDATQLPDGTLAPLNDLSHCTVTLDVQVDGADAQTKDLPATSPQGGGQSITQFIFPIANPATITGMEAAATCTDLSGNTSAALIVQEPLTIIVPDDVPPTQPLNLIFEVS